MADTPIFVPHLYAKPPRENAPSFVKARISLKGEDIAALAEFLSSHVKADGWLNFELCEARDASKWYFKLDQWTKDGAKTASQSEPKDSINPDDIPF